MNLDDLSLDVNANVPTQTITQLGITLAIVGIVVVLVWVMAKSYLTPAQ